MGTHDSGGDVHVHSPATYLLTYVALVLLLGLSLWFHHLELGRWALAAGLLVGVSKAYLIGLFFMHLKDSERLTVWTALAGVVWLSILFLLTFSDYLTRPIFPVPGK